MNTNRMKFRIDLYALKSSEAKCNLPCSYCHLDYFPVRRVFDPAHSCELSDLITLCINASGRPVDKLKLHYSGRADPLLVQKETLASELKKIHDKFPCAEKVITSNSIRLSDYARVLASSGIQKVNVSHHNYDAVLEGKVLAGIDRARNLGMKTVLNIVATEAVIADISRFIKLGDDNDLELKFFHLIMDDKSVSEEMFKRFLHKLEDQCSGEPLQDESSNRIVFASGTGNKITVKLPEKFNDRPEECLQCPRLRECDESCWDTIRITPWYVKPCGVRDDNIYFASEESPAILHAKLKSGGKISILNNSLK